MAGVTARQCTTPRCRRSPRDAFVCPGCAEELVHALVGHPDPGSFGMPALVADLSVAINRESRLAPSSGASGSDTPMPFSHVGSEAAWVLGNTLVTWVRVLAEDRGLELAWPVALGRPAHLVTTSAGIERTDRTTLARPNRAALDIIGSADFLVRHIDAVRQSEAGGELVDEVTSAVAQARRAVDRPPTPVFLGRCDHCDAELLADARATEVACASCGWSYSVDNRRRRMEQRMRGHLGTASEIAGLLGEQLGIKVTVQLISMWKSRRKITARGERRGHDLLLVGEVLDVARFSAPRRSE